MVDLNQVVYGMDLLTETKARICCPCEAGEIRYILAIELVLGVP